jgi:hypothetical protein
VASRRKLIVVEIVTRLQAIRRAAGFNTDAGLHVHVNEVPVLGPDDPDEAIVVVLDEDFPGHQAEHTFIRLPIDVQAMAKADPVDVESALMTAEDVLEDVKRAIELPDRTLGGLVQRQIERGTTRTMARDPGTPHVGVAVRYTAPYIERWGSP